MLITPKEFEGKLRVLVFREISSETLSTEQAQRQVGEQHQCLQALLFYRDSWIYSENCAVGTEGNYEKTNSQNVWEMAV